MTTSSERRQFSAQEKVNILKRHLVEKIPVADLCDEFQLNPNVFYKWMKLFFERAPLAFEANSKPERDAKDKKFAALEAKRTQKNEVLAELILEHVQLKKILGNSERRLGSHDTRDQIVDFVNHWTTRAELPRKNLVTWIGIAMSKFHHWKLRYGKINEHNADVPRDAWLQDWEN